MLETPIAQKSQNQIQRNYETLDGYSFNPFSDKWKLSRNVTINWERLRPHVNEVLFFSINSVLTQYAIRDSAAHTSSNFERLLHFCRWASRNGTKINEIEATSLANYRASLDKRNGYYVGVIAGLIRRWAAMSYPGLGAGILPMLDMWNLKGNIKGEAVQLQSVEEGAFSDLEFEAFYLAVSEAFQRGSIKLTEFALGMLSAFSGRRPAQISDLKAKDFLQAVADDGLTEYVLHVPRRKQRGGSFRNDFKPYALNVDNGKTLVNLIKENNTRLAKLQSFECAITESELPLFPNWKRVEQFVSSPITARKDLPVDFLHLSTDQVRARIQKVAEICSVISERTGLPLRVSPIRFRRTMGTRGAREGYGPLMIAELLDHSDIQNAGVYTENIPEHVDAINQAVALQLAPIAQAFAGKLVDEEAFAVRGDDPSSRIRENNGRAMGTCGHFGFCGALAPIACYTCASFQPWLHGPHEDVLNSLMAENARIKEITGDQQIANITNRTILAVTRVIQLCDERKRSLG